MRKSAASLVLAMMLISCAGLHAQNAPSVSADIQSLIGVLAYNIDNGTFLGEFNFTMNGLEKGDVRITVENQTEKTVLDGTYPCVENYSESGTPSCAVTSSGDKAGKYLIESGPHVMRVFRNAVEVYSLSFEWTVKEDNGYKSVYLNGDWSKMAKMDLTAAPGLQVTVYAGSPKTCGGEGATAQVSLLRDGAFVAMGHIEGMYYEACSSAAISFFLFSVDAEHFTTWFTAPDLLKNDGNYELVYYTDKKEVGRYAFRVEKEQVAGKAPSGLQPGLQPQSVMTPYNGFWFYQAGN